MVAGMLHYYNPAAIQTYQLYSPFLTKVLKLAISAWNISHTNITDLNTTVERLAFCAPAETQFNWDPLKQLKPEHREFVEIVPTPYQTPFPGLDSAIITFMDLVIQDYSLTLDKTCAQWLS